MRAPSWGPALVVSALVASAAAAADDPTERRPVDSGIEERIEVQLFQVNFIAVDRDGRPIENLTADEIEIVDQGRKQEVAFLERYYRPAGPRAAEAEAPANETRPEPEVPGVAIRADRPVSPGRWVVLFFDNLLSDQGTKLHAIEAAREFVRDKLAPEDQIAIVSFTGSFDLVQPFTRDRLRLEDSLGEVLDDVDVAKEDRYGELDTLMDMLQRCREAPSPWGCASRHAGAYEDSARRDAERFLVTMLQLVRSIAAIPDTKAIVAFSKGFPRNPSSDAIDAARVVLGWDVADRMMIGQDYRIDDLYDELAEAAAEAKVSIFTINPGGAMSNQSSSAEYSKPLNEVSNPMQIDVFRRTESNRQLGLSELARRTGGTASQSANIAKALDRVVDVTRGLYTAGFYPNLAVPSSVHDVKIKVKRRGVKALTRREVPIPLRRPPLTGELTVDGSACSEGGRRLMTVKVRIDFDALEFAPVDKDTVSSNFALYSRFVRSNGQEALHQEYRLFNITYTPDRYSAGGLPDPTVEQTFVVPCEDLDVEVTATDAESGAKGVLRRTLPAS